MTRSLAALLSLLGATTAAVAEAPPAKPGAKPTPASVLAAAPAGDWTMLDPRVLMVMDFANGGRVIVALAPSFAPVHVANIAAMARAGFYDGLWIERVQDNYVTQWGDPSEKKPLPADTIADPPAEYERASTGLTFRALPYRDTYARRVGLSNGWPVALERGRAWLTHCYGMVGVGRDVNPSTGNGSELYTVIGQPARPLDRNIAVVGRIVSGMAAMTALPRGTAALGFYATEKERLPITHVRMADQMPEAERPKVEWLDTNSASYAAWLQVRANRQDDFFLRPAGAIDLCNALPPVRINGKLPGAVGK